MRVGVTYIHDVHTHLCFSDLFGSSVPSKQRTNVYTPQARSFSFEPLRGVRRCCCPKTNATPTSTT